MHRILNIALPFVLLILVNIELVPIAILLVFLSKWRTFAVRMNHLPANLRANMTDLIFKLSILSFIIDSTSLNAQVVFATVYAVWLMFVKPRSGRRFIGIQALLSQAVGLSAIMWFSDSLNIILVLAGVWVVVYTTSQHYLSSFDDTMSRVLTKIWAMFAVQLAWLFAHWNLRYFGAIPQFVLVQVAFSYLVADLYRERQEGAVDSDKLRNYILATVVIIAVILISGDWSGQIV